jgi:hypothetical protein
MVADFLRDPQAHPLPDPPIQGLTMADPKDSKDSDDKVEEFEFDDDELDDNGQYIGSESVRLQQEATDDE